MEQDMKVRENRLRRVADRQGLVLEKSPRRDSRALGYGTYRLLKGRKVVASSEHGFGLTMDEVEEFLS